jgi:D-alanyl-D-alanine carboxypeptidase
LISFRFSAKETAGAVARPLYLAALVGLFGGFASLAPAAVYRGAIVVDVDSGATLFEDRADYVGPPASVTKLMTFLVVHDLIEAGRFTLDTPVTVSAADSRMGGTQVWLKHNEVFPVRELLYALMIQSANDAALALTHAADGMNREQFVSLMNDRARSLGMTDTIWRTPHGLPPRSRKLSETDQTSPRDLVRLAMALIEETDVLYYSAIEKRPFGTGVRDKTVAMDSHNNLLGKVAGVDGLKTGFTRAAGFCLAATAERHGRRIVAVIMGSPTSQERDIKMAELIENAFAADLPEPATLRTQPRPSVAPAPVAPAAPGVIFTPIDPDAPLDSNATTDEPPTVIFELP